MWLRMNKTNNAYKSIGEVAKILNLVNKKNGNFKYSHYKILGKGI